MSEISSGVLPFLKMPTGEVFSMLISKLLHLILSHPFPHGYSLFSKPDAAASHSFSSGSGYSKPSFNKAVNHLVNAYASYHDTPTTGELGLFHFLSFYNPGYSAFSEYFRSLSRINSFKSLVSPSQPSISPASARTFGSPSVSIILNNRSLT